MDFRVRFLDPQAMAVRQQRMAAQSEADLRQQLAHRGSQVLQVEPASAWRLDLSGWRRSRGGGLRKTSEIALFCRELRALTTAGLSVVEALEALAAQQVATDEGELAVAGLLLQRLRAGRSLSAAMADAGGFPPLLIASIQSSERTSNLADALDAYLHYDEVIGTLRRRIVSAALYPAIVVALGLLIAVFLLWVVIPRFASLYGQMGQGAGTATVVLLELSKALREAPWLVPVAGLVFVMLAGWLVSGGRAAALGRALTVRWPLLARPARHFELARLYEALALLCRGGFSLHESLALCQGIAPSRAARGRIQQAQEAVERGVSVSHAFAAGGLTDDITQRLLRSSERGGDFGAVLMAISKRHASAFETFVERATRVVEPVLLLGVALLVGGMVVLLYMPIFDIASAIR
ncbi:MAG TPA: type II secretion system F family protein [Aquabacterium sp.]|nr:type II secretion system F family protein [Aquabacterium sp.]